MNNTTGRLRRNKATTFESPSIPKAFFDLQHHFIFSKRKAPVDGIEAIQRDGASISEHAVVKYANDERPDEKEKQDLENMFKTVLRIGVQNSDIVYTHLLQLSQCYEAMARNNKLIVFTNDISVRKAFNGLIYNCMRTGLVADSQTLEITGVLSVTDFIMVLMMLWKYRENLDELKGTPLSHEDFRQMDIAYMPISRWKGCLETKGQLKPFINIGLKESIFRAVELLTKYRIHRLPVMDEKTGDCAYILTHRRILHYIWKHCALLPKPECLSQRVVDLEIGSWKNLIFANEQTPLIECLDMLIDNNISGIPIVQKNTLKVLEVYTRFDAASAAFSDHIDLSVSVTRAIQERDYQNGIRRDGVVTANYTTTLWSLIEIFIDKNVHRIFMVDDRTILKGIISLSDVIEFLVLRPTKKNGVTTGEPMEK
ncbi:CBS domain-containing protein [Caenorhabditis elegans]|uniref:CBS domain-containing protein n=1 Tax=Caenorhabditis elegans TaxID=6239 RepID=Q9N501_CAEEL|nr:CBS domain-containing protein [Caenorhabditis elegans]CCD74419.1 CBS domain-containing protein [Caenorhabditis elegans]|eukprot:NP_508509.3 AMP-Activated protein Kinase Gamma subunit [Caenorhabditis elegans]